MRKLKFDKFSKQQLIAVSEIARDGAQVIFGGLVINQIFAEFGKINWVFVFWGIISCLGLWVLSVLILKK